MDQRNSISSTPPNLVTVLGTQVIEDHLKIDYASESAYVDALCAAVVDTIQRELGIQYGAGSISTEMTAMPKQFTLPVDAARVSGIVIGYTDEEGDIVTVDATNYFFGVLGYPMVIGFAKDFEMTSLDDSPYPVTVTANVSAIDIPASIQQAALFLLGHWYENREAVDKKMHKTPLAFDRLIAPHKVSYLRHISDIPGYSIR